MLGKGMPISKKDYEELKPYYDYQRKVAYNKEVEDEMINFCLKISLEIVPESIIFRCTYEG